MKITITILISFLIVSTAYAANTLYVFDTDWNQLDSISINAGTDVNSVYFDGVYFWIGEGNNVNQYFLTNDDTLAQVDSWSMTTCDSAATAVGGITGNGVHLIISYVATLAKRVAYCDKEGNPVDGFGFGNTGDPIQDITWNDIQFAFTRVDGAANPVLNFFDPLSEKIVKSIVTIVTFSSVAWNGVNFHGNQIGASGQGYVFDTNGVILGSERNTIASPAGIDFGHGFSDFEYGFGLPIFENGGDQNDGALIFMVGQ